MERFRSRLSEYTYQSSHVSVEYIDPDKRPADANKYQVQTYGTVIVDYNGRLERVTSDSEQDITNAVIKAVQGQQKKVYFIQGHGEKDPTNSERDGYNSISAALTRDNFSVDKLVLSQQTAVPDDASVLIIAGPKTDFFPAEMDRIRAYMAKGGKLMVMVDPDDTGKGDPMPLLAGLLADWNVQLGNDIVVDMGLTAQMSGAGPVVPVVGPPYPPHVITERFRLATAYPLTRSVDQSERVLPTRVLQKFIQTSADSFAETNLEQMRSGGQVGFDIATDKKGPVSIGVTVVAPPGLADLGPDKGANAPKTEGRMVVIGDSDFPANAYVNISGNQDLFVNTVNWLAQQESLISIRARDPEDRRITLTVDQMRRIFMITIFIIPGIVLSAGIRSWWRRR
jgi:ABC-type uncharacterized transport system involved in gliding motility auxiliary subunit